MYVYKHNTYTCSVAGVRIVGPDLPFKNLLPLQLKNKVQSDTDCMKFNNPKGCFQLEWKALFDLNTLVILSNAPPLGSPSYMSSVNKLSVALTCTDFTSCSKYITEQDTMFQNPEI